MDAEARLTSVQAFVEPDAYVIAMQGLAADTINVIPEIHGLDVEQATDRLRRAGFNRRPRIADAGDGVVTAVSIRHDPGTGLDGTVDVPISDGATVVIAAAPAETPFVLTTS